MGDDTKKVGFLGRFFGKGDSPEDTPETNDLTPEQRTRREFLIKGGRAMAGIALGGAIALSGGEAKAGYHHERRDDTDHRVPDEFVERMQNEELMRPAEVKRMQNCQEIVFRHYLNPSFHVHLKRTLDQRLNSTTNMQTNVALEALETIMKYPHELSYKEVQREYGDVIEITQRPTAPGSTAGTSHVPANFKVTIEDGFVTKVGNKDLILRGEPVPWESPSEYEGDISDAHKKILNAVMNYPVDMPSGLSRAEKIKYGKKKKMESVPAHLQDAYKVITLELAHRINDSISTRNTSGSLDPDLSNHSGYQEMLTLLKQQPKRYDQAAENSPTIDVGASPRYPGLYFVVRTSDFQPLVIVSHEGYIMKRSADNGKFEPDPAYKYDPDMGANRLTERYYDQEPAAKNLTDL